MWMSIQEPYILTVQPDDFILNPRREIENFGTMICFHRRYDLGDEHKYNSSDDLIKELYIKAVGGGERGEEKYEELMDRFDMWPVTLQQIQAKNQALMSAIDKEFVVLPVFLFDHSGLSVSTYSFNDPWDSGQTGIIYASKERICEEYGVKVISPQIRREVEKQLRGEVETYDTYLSGECYGYELYKNGEILDSCWGFAGRFDKACEDIAEFLPDDCKGMVNKLSEVNDAPSVIHTLLKHARIQVNQAVKDHEHKPRQKSLEAILS